MRITATFTSGISEWFRWNQSKQTKIWGNSILTFSVIISNPVIVGSVWNLSKMIMIITMIANSDANVKRNHINLRINQLKIR